MTDAVAVALIAAVPLLVTQITTFLLNRRKLTDVQTKVDGQHTESIRQIAALKGEIGKLNENTTNSTPQTGGDVNLQHGQVIVPTKEPEVKG